MVDLQLLYNRIGKDKAIYIARLLQGYDCPKKASYKKNGYHT